MTEYTFASTDPDRYYEIFCPVPHMSSSTMIDWSVTQLSGFCNVMVLTKDDYITFEYGDVEKYKINMDDDMNYVDSGFFEVLQEAIQKQIKITVSVDKCGRYIFSSDEKSFEIIDASYRMKQVLGLYNETFPLKAIETKEGETIHRTLKIRSTGYSMYTPMLMLISNMGAPNVIADTKNPVNYGSYSIVMKFSNNMTAGQPLNASGTEPPIRSTSNSLGNIRLRLVDMNLEPVLVLSPLMVTISVSDIKEQMQEHEEALAEQEANKEFHKARQEFYQSRHQKKEQKIITTEQVKTNPVLEEGIAPLKNEEHLYAANGVGEPQTMEMTQTQE